MALPVKAETRIQSSGFRGNQFIRGATQKDFAPMEFRLIQSSSEASKTGQAEQGKFYCPQSGDIYEELPFVPLFVQCTRTLWSAEDMLPTCSSNDRIKANPGSYFEGRLCEQCEFRNDEPWLLDAEERRSYCTPGYTLMAVNVDTGMPFIFRAANTQVKAIQNMNTLILMAGKPYRLQLSFTAKVQARGRNSFYGLFVNKRGMVPEAELDGYREMAEYWAGAEVNWTPDGSDSNGQPAASPPAAPVKQAPGPISPPSVVATVVQTPTAPTPVRKAPVPPGTRTGSRFPNKPAGRGLPPGGLKAAPAQVTESQPSKEASDDEDLPW